MRVLLGSGGFRTEERVQFLTGLMRSFFGDIERLLFIPYALHDHDRYLQVLQERKLDASYALDGIHRHADPKQAVQEAQAIYVGGGNTFRLLKRLYDFGLLDLIRARVRAGMPYLGISAGTNVACPTIRTTNDMPIATPPSLDALGLVPFQINPHYYTGQFYLKTADGYQEHFGETRDERIREFHEMNDTPVLGLWEAGVLRLEDGSLTLLGTPARIFRKGQESVDIEPGAALDVLLAPPSQAVVYTVAVTFTDAALADEWLRWLRGGHLAEVLAGGATDAQLVELDGPGRAFEVRYHFPSREAFAAYERDHAPRLRAEGLQRFPVEQGVSYRRSVGVVQATAPSVK